MLLTDPEIESSLLISSDEGATYQKYRLNFYIQSLLFHPKQEDWILAYSQDQKVSMCPHFMCWGTILLGRNTRCVSLHLTSMMTSAVRSPLNFVPVGAGETEVLFAGLNYVTV